MQYETIVNAITTARLVDHTVYLKATRLISVYLTDTEPKAPYILVTAEGNVSEVK